MRDLFINLFEKLVSIIIILMILAVLAFSIMMMAGGGVMMVGPMGEMGGGLVPGLIFLVAGLIYVIFVGGFMYLGLGIYQNTKATAEAVRGMAGRG